MIFMNDGTTNNNSEKLNKLLKLIKKYDPLKPLLKEEYNALLSSLNADDKKFINKVLSANWASYYKIKNDQNIPDDLKEWIHSPLTEIEYQNLKHMMGKYSKKVNEFLTNHFEEYLEEELKLKKNLSNDDKIKFTEIILNSDLNNRLTYKVIRTVFGGINDNWRYNYYQFIIHNFDVIISRSENRLKCKRIIENFDELSKYYKSLGNNNFDFKSALDYLERPLFTDIWSYIEYINAKGENLINIKKDDSGVYQDLKIAVDYFNNPLFFNIRPGNEYLAVEVKKAGINKQDSFEYYQNLNDKMLMRKERTLPNYDEEFDIIIDNKKYKIKASILDMHSPLNMLIGEVNYANSYRKYSDIGQTYMEQAATSPNDGIFCLWLIDDNNKILLTHSKVHVKQNVFYFDDIEISDIVKNTSSQVKYKYDQIIKQSYDKVACQLPNLSKNAIERYIKDILSKQITILDKDKISSDLAKYQIINKVIIMASNEQQVIYDSGNTTTYDPDYKMLPIYRNTRGVKYQKCSDIDNIMVKKIVDIERQSLPEKLRSLSFETKRCVYPYEIAESFDENKDNLSIVIGEDWYCIYVDYYELYETENIYVGELARVESRFDNERGVQQVEMFSFLKKLLESCIVVYNNSIIIKTILASLRENTSYLLYLYCLKLGLIEQIESDVSEAEQKQIFKNRNDIKNNVKYDNEVYEVLFKPSDNFINRYLKDKGIDNKYRRL